MKMRILVIIGVLMIIFGLFNPLSFHVLNFEPLGYNSRYLDSIVLVILGLLIIVADYFLKKK